MHEYNSQDWHHLIAPDDTRDRLLLTLLRLLLDKEVITEEEPWNWADPKRQGPKRQEPVTEEDSRTQWHTTWLTTEELAAKVTLSRDSVLLDAGSGFGGPARQLAEDFGCRVIGIDRDPLRVLHAIRQTERMGLSDRVSFCWGIFQNLPFPEECFDVVWAMASVVADYDGKWDDKTPTGMDRRIFHEFHRVLKHNGRLVCQVAVKGPLGDDDLPQFLRLVGFTPEDVEDCTETWLACMKWAIGETSPEIVKEQSLREAYDGCVRRQDKAYRFVATKENDHVEICRD